MDDGAVTTERGADGTQEAGGCRVSRWGEDVGMATAEYAVATVAACGFGTVLYRVLTSEAVGGVIRDLIERAITSVFG